MARNTRKKQKTDMKGKVFAYLGLAGVALTFLGWNLWGHFFPTASEKQASRIEEKADQLLDRMGTMERLLKPTEKEVKSELEKELSAEMGRKQQEALRLFLEASQDIDYGRASQAVAKLEKALTIAKIPSFQLVIGVAQFLNNDYSQSAEHFLAAWEGYRIGANRKGEAAALAGLGKISLHLGNLGRAMGLFKQALHIDQSLGDRAGEAGTFREICRVHLAEHEFSKALRLQEQALDIYRELNMRDQQADTLYEIGCTYMQWGAIGAEEMFKLAINIYRELEDKPGQAHAMNMLGIVYKDLWNNYRLAQQLKTALMADVSVSDGEINTLRDDPKMQTSEGKGDLEHFIISHLQLSKQSFQQALTLYEQLGDLKWQANALGNLANVHRESGDYAIAETHLKQSLMINQVIRNPLAEAKCLGNLGLVYQAQGNLKESEQHLAQAVGIFKDIGAASELAIAEKNIALAKQLMARQPVPAGK